MNDQNTKADVASRRHLLKLGAMAAPAVITLAPASARAAASVLNCRVPFPQNVDSNGDACATPSSQATGLGNGNASATGNANANPNAHQNSGWPGGTKPGNGNGLGNGLGNGSANSASGSENICYEGPGQMLNADEVNNLQSVAAARSTSGDAYERYEAYAKYLKKVEANNLPGASCLMSINTAGR